MQPKTQACVLDLHTKWLRVHHACGAADLLQGHVSNRGSTLHRQSLQLRAGSGLQSDREALVDGHHAGFTVKAAQQHIGGCMSFGQAIDRYGEDNWPPALHGQC